MQPTHSGTKRPPSPTKLSPERAAILSYLKSETAPVQARDIARAVKQSRGSTRHLLRSLAGDGLVQHHSQGRYSCNGVHTFEQNGSTYAMTKPHSELDDAKAKLEALREQLPQHHERLHTAESERNELQEAVTRGSATFDDLATAEGRVSAAERLLERHQAAIEAARSQVLNLERAAEQNKRLEAMCGAAEEARKALEGSGRKVNKLNTLLLQELSELRRLEGQFFSAVRLFADLGNQAAGEKLFRSHFVPLSAEEEARANALFTELEKRGANLSAVRRGADDLRLTMLNQQRDASPEPYGSSLYGMMSYLEALNAPGGLEPAQGAPEGNDHEKQPLHQ